MAAVIGAFVGRFVQDDAFITYRFSRNMARGEGLVFNPGERVEGYTNFLWTVIHVIPEKFGWSTPAFSQILGILTMIVALAGALRLAERLLGTEQRALFAGAVLVANVTFVGYGTGGLETMLQTALVVWLAVLVLGTTSEDDAPPLVSRSARVGAGFLAGLAVLTRLDSSVLIAGWFGAYLWRERRRVPPATLVRHATELALPALALVGPWLIWKLDYYGNLLPNTFYAKSAANPLVPMSVGVFYLVLFFASYAAFLLLGRWRALRGDLRALDGVGTAFFVAAIWMVYIVAVGADFMEFRFMVPILPILAIGASYLLDHFRNVRRQLALVGVLLAVSMAHFVFPNGVYPVLSFAELSHWPNESRTTWLAMGEKLADTFPGGPDVPGQPMIAVAPLGVISYYSDLPTIDMLGLSDATVAREGRPFPLYYPGHVRMANVDYLIERNVSLVVGQPSWEERTERESYLLSEVVRFYPVADLNELPDSARVIEIPLTEDKMWRIIYLTQNDKVDDAIATNGWETFPIERRCDEADLTGPLLSPEWIDRQGADLTCPDL